MKIREILSIISLSALALCLLCGLSKMAMKSDKARKGCDKLCSLLVFLSVVLIGVNQLLEEIDEKLELGKNRSFWLQSDSESDCIDFIKYRELPNPLKLPARMTKCYEKESENCKKDYCIGKCVDSWNRHLLMYFKSDSDQLPTCPDPNNPNKLIQQFTE